jgi:hypothetical protein
MKPARRDLVLLFATLLASAGASETSRVAVLARARGDDLEQKAGDGRPSAGPVTYFLVEGRRFHGLVRDPSLESVKFAQVAGVLNQDLRKSGFSAVSSPKSSKLLLVAHWGVTDVDEDVTRAQTDFARMSADIDAHNLAVAKVGVGEIGTVYMDLVAVGEDAPAAMSPLDFNAHLLGYSSALRREEYLSRGVPSGMTYEDRVLREDLIQARYFVVLLAYDIHSQAGATRPKLAWSTRFSTRSSGHDFMSVLPGMSRMASAYFGREVEGLVRDAGQVP